MEQLQPDNASHKSITGSSDSAELWQLQAPVVSLTFKPEDQSAQDSSSGRVTVSPTSGLLVLFLIVDVFYCEPNKWVIGFVFNC